MTSKTVISACPLHSFQEDVHKTGGFFVYTRVILNVRAHLINKHTLFQNSIAEHSSECPRRQRTCNSFGWNTTYVMSTDDLIVQTKSCVRPRYKSGQRPTQCYADKTICRKSLLGVRTDAGPVKGWGNMWVSSFETEGKKNRKDK